MDLQVSYKKKREEKCAIRNMTYWMLFCIRNRKDTLHVCKDWKSRSKGMKL
ncbi:hypothetical protein QSI_2703 [Clostridioides difficile P28]|nr:hypothetical protein QSI_2703 [Clostridioides difficile P28]